MTTTDEDALHAEVDAWLENVPEDRCPGAYAAERFAEWQASRKVEAALTDTDRRFAELEATAKDWYEESERVFDKVMAIRHWAHDNQEHEVYEATEDQPAECTDECAWCALDEILNTSPPRTSQPVQVTPEALAAKMYSLEYQVDPDSATPGDIDDRLGAADDLIAWLADCAPAQPVWVEHARIHHRAISPSDALGGGE